MSFMCKNIKANYAGFLHNSTKEMVSYLMLTDRIGPQINFPRLKYVSKKKFKCLVHKYCFLSCTFIPSYYKNVSWKLNDAEMFTM